MDEYSPKRHDIAQLQFLCENLYHESVAALGDTHHGWVNDPTSMVNLQLNELIEHIATFTVSYKIKHVADRRLAEQIDEYLDNTFTLFSNYGITTRDFQCWQETANQLFKTFSEECDPVRMQPSHSIL